MGKIVMIKNALVNLLSDLELNGSPAFSTVTDSTAKDFDSYPVARVLPSPNVLDDEVGAWSQQDRGVNMQIVVHVPLEDPTRIQADKIDHMLDLTDLIVDCIDMGDHDQALSAIDAAASNYMMSVSEVTLDPVQSKGGALLMLVVSVKVSYSKDL